MRILRLILLIFLIQILTSSITYSQESVRLPYFFSSDMVLQREKPIKIWGTYAPKKDFEIVFAGEKQKVKPGESGKWKVEFPSMKAGGPYEMKFLSDSSFTLDNILIGDVWLCSGQSNMQWLVMSSFNSGYELRNANIPEIRSFKVPHKLSSFPLDNALPAKWKISTPDNAAFFSAVAYFFAKNIHLSENVPVGIINSSWGGTIIEAWTGLESLATHPDFKEAANQLKSTMGTDHSFEALLDKSEEENNKW